MKKRTAVLLAVLVATSALAAVEITNVAQARKARFNGHTSGVTGTGAQAVAVDHSDKATYTACSAAQTPTAAATLLSVEAGTTNKVRLLSLWIVPGSQTTAAYHQITVRRITTASTVGTVLTPSPHDPADAAFTGRVAVAPTPGTAGVTLFQSSVWVPTATTVREADRVVLYEDAQSSGNGRGKAIVIAAGVANGIEIRNNTGGAGAANFYACATFTEEST